jgi:hypothetical protein
MDIINNYKAMKTASKVSVAKTDSDTIYKVTRKVFDADTGDAKDDVVQNISMEFVSNRLATITAEKEDLEQFKTDAEAL